MLEEFFCTASYTSFIHSFIYCVDYLCVYLFNRCYYSLKMLNYTFLRLTFFVCFSLWLKLQSELVKSNLGSFVNDVLHLCLLEPCQMRSHRFLQTSCDKERKMLWNLHSWWTSFMNNPNYYFFKRSSEKRGRNTKNLIPHGRHLWTTPLKSNNIN
jgi:hypothetical protein